MGLFWDKLKGLFGIKEENRVQIAQTSVQIAVKLEKNERNERREYSVYNPRLAHTKNKSQRKNWKHWRNRK